MHVENFDTKPLLDSLQSCFSRKEIESIARSSKFIQRSTSRLSGMSFLLMNIFDSSTGKERSLNDSCDWLAEHFDINLTKQSLDERYNTDAVRFIRTCYNRVLEKINTSVIESVKTLPFTRIQITDSTSFKVSSNLSSFYLGNGGDGGESMIKMHLNYNLLNGGVTDVALTDGVANDNLYKLGKEEKIEEKGLYIRDLGYFSYSYFNNLENNKAFFLSRIKSNSAYYLKNESGKYKRISIEDYLPKKGQVKELSEVYIGNGKNKVKARLVMQSVPEEIAIARLKKLKRSRAKKKYNNLSEQAKDMCWFNMYITNATQEELPTKLIRLVYSLRWQIELMFKIWKSVFNIDKVKKMSIFRFECYIYSRLIAILITLQIQNRLGQYLWEESNFELSPMKSAKLIKKNY